MGDKGVPSFPPPRVVSRHRAYPDSVSIGDTAEVLLDSPLLDWLMTSPVPGEPPPARGLHPMSGVPLGLAMEAAIAAANGDTRCIDTARACEIDFVSPVRPGELLSAHARIIEVAHRHVVAEVKALHPVDGTMVLKARIILVHVANGRAVQIRPASFPDS